MTQMRSEVLEHLGIDATDLDATGSDNLDLLINRSWWEVCDKFSFKEKEALATFNTVAGTRSYDLPTNATSFEALQLVAYKDPDTDAHIHLKQTSWHWYEQNYSEDSDEQDAPEFYLRKDNDLYIYPTPDDVYTITLHYLKTLDDLSSSLAIPQAWHEIILFGAVWRGKMRQNDSAGAMVFKRHQLALIESSLTTASKEDREQKYHGVEVLGREY